MTTFKSKRRQRFETLRKHFMRYPIREVEHYVACAYPRTLRAAALAVLRERSAS